MDVALGGRRSAAGPCPLLLTLTPSFRSAPPRIKLSAALDGDVSLASFFFFFTQIYEAEWERGDASAVSQTRRSREDLDVGRMKKVAERTCERPSDTCQYTGGGGSAVTLKGSRGSAWAIRPSVHPSVRPLGQRS